MAIGTEAYSSGRSGVGVLEREEMTVPKRRLPVDYEQQARELLDGLVVLPEHVDTQRFRYGEPLANVKLPEVSEETLAIRDRFDSITAVNSFYRGVGAEAIPLSVAFELIDDARMFLDNTSANEGWHRLVSVPNDWWEHNKGVATMFDGVRSLFDVRNQEHILRDDITQQSDPLGTVVHLARYREHHFLIAEMSELTPDNGLVRSLWAADVKNMHEVLNRFSLREAVHADAWLRNGGATREEIETIFGRVDRLDMSFGGDTVLSRTLIEVREERKRPRHAEPEVGRTAKIARTVRDLGRAAFSMIRRREGRHRAVDSPPANIDDAVNEITRLARGSGERELAFSHYT